VFVCVGYICVCVGDICLLCAVIVCACVCVKSNKEVLNDVFVCFGCEFHWFVYVNAHSFPVKLHHQNTRDMGVSKCCYCELYFGSAYGNESGSELCALIFVENEFCCVSVCD